MATDASRHFANSSCAAHATRAADALSNSVRTRGSTFSFGRCGVAAALEKAEKEAVEDVEWERGGWERGEIKEVDLRGGMDGEGEGKWEGLDSKEEGERVRREGDGEGEALGRRGEGEELRREEGLRKEGEMEGLGRDGARRLRGLGGKEGAEGGGLRGVEGGGMGCVEEMVARSVGEGSEKEAVCCKGECRMFGRVS